MENKKNTGKTILLFVIAIVLTFVLVGVKIGTGFIKHKDNIMFGVNITNESKNKVFEGVYDNIYDSVYCYSDAGNVEIKESKDDFIHITIFSEDDYSYVSEDESELSIISLHEDDKLNYKNTANKIIVEIPDNYIGILDINLDYGNVVVGSFENATLSAYLECGNIDVKSIKNANIHCSLGDIKIKDLNCYCDIYNNCGNIEIDHFNMMENSTIYDDLGNITIHHINNVKVEAQTDLGKVDVDSNPLSELVLNIYNDCGNIEVNNKSLEL